MCLALCSITVADKNNIRSALPAQVGVPIRLLHEGEGHVISVELKNGTQSAHLRRGGGGAKAA